MIGVGKMSLILENYLKKLNEIAKRKDVSKADKTRALSKYGKVVYADEKNKKYPLMNPDHVRAALRYFGMPRNYEKYSPEDRKKILAKIKRAANKFGIK